MEAIQKKMQQEVEKFKSIQKGTICFIFTCLYFN